MKQNLSLRILSILAILTTAFLSCKKGNNEPAETLNNTYQPVTKGSYWKYNEVSPYGTKVSTTTMTGEKVVINNRIYDEYTTVIDGLNTTGIGYFYVKDGIIMATASSSSEALFLKENAAVGETWIFMGPMNDEVPGNITSETYSIIAKVIEKGIAHTVAGKTFKNVIHIKHIQQFTSGATVDLNDYYIAKGVGMIERKKADGTFSSLLIDYSIK